VLSYLFYFVAVAIIAGSLGYFAAIGVLEAIGLEMGFLVWLIGIIVAVALIFVTLRFNLQKWVIIIATSLLGAGVVFGAFFVMFNPATQLMKSPIKAMLSSSPLLMFLALVLAIVGILVQYRSSKTYTIEAYNNWE